MRRGEQPELSTREKHKRQCFVVLQAGAHPEYKRQAIVTTPFQVSSGVHSSSQSRCPARVSYLPVRQKRCRRSRLARNLPVPARRSRRCSPIPWPSP
ncbi:hypothetical protein K3217_15325 [bacterium BD-1]|nr:hypothetical protein [Ottowia caeni]